MLVVNEHKGYFLAVLKRCTETGFSSSFCKLLDTSWIGTFVGILNTKECRCSGWLDHLILLTRAVYSFRGSRSTRLCILSRRLTVIGVLIAAGERRVVQREQTRQYDYSCILMHLT